MKMVIEFSDLEEMRDFLRWSQDRQSKSKRQAELKAIDDAYGRTEIANLGFPKAILSIMRGAGVSTIEQASAMTDTEWMKTPMCGRKQLQTIRELLEAHKKANK